MDIERVSAAFSYDKRPVVKLRGGVVCESQESSIDLRARKGRPPQLPSTEGKHAARSDAAKTVAKAIARKGSTAIAAHGPPELTKLGRHRHVQSLGVIQMHK